jgi:hypothetical protein
MLRIDYHIDNLDNPIKGKHYSILIKALKDQ